MVTINNKVLFEVPPKRPPGNQVIVFMPEIETNMLNFLPEFRSQMMQVLSSEQVTALWPSGVIEISFILSLCPSSKLSILPVDRSHRIQL